MKEIRMIPFFNSKSHITFYKVYNNNSTRLHKCSSPCPCTKGLAITILNLTAF